MDKKQIFELASRIEDHLLRIRQLVDWVEVLPSPEHFQDIRVRLGFATRKATDIMAETRRVETKPVQAPLLDPETARYLDEQE